ncbi:MAG: hypothetical protein FWF57_04190 [Defluviitaleaceae bacterium]|nr:hypothetical protein [Defluviitaleaceae bacterium]
MLYIDYSEDYGFVIRIFEHGKQPFHLSIDYNLHYNICEDVEMDIYGEDTWYSLDLVERLEKVQAEYGEIIFKKEINRLNDIFSKKFYERLDDFKIFDINNEDIENMKKILTVENFCSTSKVYPQTLFNEFLKILGIYNLEFFNSKYIDRNTDRFEVLN